GGIFGHVETYFATTETNGRGMLHVHGLMFFEGNLNSAELREQLMSDTHLQSTLITFVESLVKNEVDETLTMPVTAEAALGLPHMRISQTDDPDQFREELYRLSNLVAISRNMHTHNATCYKYNRGKDGKCRFNAPWQLNPESTINEDGILHLKRLHPMINNWNPFIAATMKCNHDISFIPTNSKFLALMYYITDYATK
ncbi:hypothetical protein FN846DRAFT_758838, partial [Sphaerosporella brunnea]